VEALGFSSSILKVKELEEYDVIAAMSDNPQDKEMEYFHGLVGSDSEIYRCPEL
jgi:hypothetical protein